MTLDLSKLENWDGPEEGPEVIEVHGPEELAAVLSRITGHQEQLHRPPEEHPLHDGERDRATEELLRLAHRFLDGALSAKEMRRDDLVAGFLLVAEELSRLAVEFAPENN